MEIYNYIDLSLSLSDPCDSSVSTAGTALVLASAYWLQQPLPLALELFRTAWPTPARRWRGWGCFATGRRLRPPGFRKTPHGHEEGDPHQTIVLLEMASGWKKTINDVSRSMDRLGHTVSTPRVGKNTETASALGN